MVVLVGVVMAIFNDLSTARERTANTRDCVVTMSQCHSVTRGGGDVTSVTSVTEETERPQRPRDRETKG